MFGFLYLVAVVALISVWAMSLRRRKVESAELRRASEELAAKFRALMLLAGGLGKDATTQEEPRQSSSAGHPQEHAVRKLDPPFQQAVAFYESHLEDLLSKYEGVYIAILDRRVIDSDDTFNELAQRVYAKFGYRDIFMPKARRKPRTISIPSPRLLRA